MAGKVGKSGEDLLERFEKDNLLRSWLRKDNMEFHMKDRPFRRMMYMMHMSRDKACKFWSQSPCNLIEDRWWNVSY